MQDFGPGTHAVEPIPGVMLCCMSESHRDCLDEIMRQWREHWPKVAANKPPGTEPLKEADDVYGFAYWLLRWSGLVVPAQHNAAAAVEGS